MCDIPKLKESNYIPLNAVDSGSNHYYWSLSYTAYSLLSSQTHWAHVACSTEWVTVSFSSEFCQIHGVGVLTVLYGCYMAGATWNRCRLGARSVYAIQPCTSLRHKTSRVFTRYNGGPIKTGGEGTRLRALCDGVRVIELIMLALPW